MSTFTRLEQRALDPVARALLRRLLVPKVYFRAPWPDASSTADLVAVDRAGTGDVHVVEIKGSARSALSARTVNRLIQVPAHYLWLAFPRPRHPYNYADAALYLADGPGRIGVVEIVPMPGDTLGANIVLPAERFHEHLEDETLRFVRQTKPDISFR